MEAVEYQNIYASEESHFYYRAVHALILQLVDKYRNKSIGKPAILEAGCGTGLLSLKLKEIGEVSAVDMHDDALRYSHARGVNSIKASVEALPFADAGFDIVTSVDVIYHKNVADDVQALKEFRRVLKPDGVLVMRVPARAELYCSHDDLVWTARRYRSSELTAKLKTANFEPLIVSYCHSLLYVPALAKAKVEKILGGEPHSGVSQTNEAVNSLMIRLLDAESKMIVSGIKMPIGLGLVAVAKRLPNR